MIIFRIGTHVRKLTVSVLQPFENKHCLNVRHVPQQAIASRFVRLQSYMMRGAYVRITLCQLTFILPLGAVLSLIHASFSVRATWLSTLLLNTPYGEARGNGRAARRLYQDRFPQRPTPSHTLFAVITQRLRERGTFTARRNACGAPRRLRTPELEKTLGCWSPHLTVQVVDLNVNYHLKRPKTVFNCNSKQKCL